MRSGGCGASRYSVHGCSASVAIRRKDVAKIERLCCLYIVYASNTKTRVHDDYSAYDHLQPRNDRESLTSRLA